MFALKALSILLIATLTQYSLSEEAKYITASFTTPTLGSSPILVYSKSIDLGEDDRTYAVFVGSFTNGMTDAHIEFRTVTSTGLSPVSLSARSISGAAYYTFSIPKLSLGRKLEVLAYRVGGSNGQLTMAIQP